MAVIQRRVYLEPKYLDRNLRSHLSNKVAEAVPGECTEEHGYVLSMTRLLDFVNNHDTIFTVRFEAKTLKPRVGDELTGVVRMVYRDGVFAEVDGVQKILVPSTALGGYAFDSGSRSYVRGSESIKEGDKIRIVVTAVKYSKKNFSCIGSLV